MWTKKSITPFAYHCYSLHEIDENGYDLLLLLLQILLLWLIYNKYFCKLCYLLSFSLIVSDYIIIFVTVFLLFWLWLRFWTCYFSYYFGQLLLVLVNELLLMLQFIVSHTANKTVLRWVKDDISGSYGSDLEGQISNHPQTRVCVVWCAMIYELVLRCVYGAVVLFSCVLFVVFLLSSAWSMPLICVFVLVIWSFIYIVCLLFTYVVLSRSCTTCCFDTVCRPDCEGLAAETFISSVRSLSVGFPTQRGVCIFSTKRF